MPSKKLNKGSSGQNRKASEQYMDKFRQKPGVQETDSGLLYREVEPGQGLTPTMDDKVVVNQRIQLVNGKVIGDTYQEGMPDTFWMKEAIAGIQEGLQLMQEGGGQQNRAQCGADLRPAPDGSGFWLACYSSAALHRAGAHTSKLDWFAVKAY